MRWTCPHAISGFRNSYNFSNPWDHELCVTRLLQNYITNISLSYRNFIPAYRMFNLYPTDLYTTLHYAGVITLITKGDHVLTDHNSYERL